MKKQSALSVRVQRLSSELWLFWQQRWLAYGGCFSILVFRSLHQLLFCQTV
jgi:hypothetical protein